MTVVHHQLLRRLYTFYNLLMLMNTFLHKLVQMLYLLSLDVTPVAILK